MAQAAAGPSFMREATLTFVIASLIGAFFQVNPGLAKSNEGVEWLWQRSPGLTVGDSPYHIRMAWLYRTGEVQAAGPDFHWTRISVWNGRFSDKDYLYHIYLIPFTVFARDAYDHDGLIKGAKLGAAMGWGVLALALLAALRLMRIRPAWPYVLLVAAGSWLFLLRFSEARSWGFSAACAILGWACILRGKRAAVFCIGVVYTLTYTASHILLLLALFHMIARLVLGPDAGSTRKTDLVRNATIAGLAALGIAVGAMLHPQPFELMRLWWVQNVLVLYMHGGGEVTGWVASISQQVLGWERVPRDLALPKQLFGAELQSTSMKFLLGGCGVALAVPLVLGGLAAAARWRPGRNEIMSMCVAGGLLVLIARSMRFSEYALPFVAFTSGLWTAGIASAPRAQAWLDQGRRRVRAARAGLAAVILAALGQTTFLVQEYNYTPLWYYPGMVLWLESADEVRGKMIYNASWDTFPELFLVRADCDYATGLDPAFAAAAGTRQSQIYVNLSLGQVGYVAADGPALVKVLRDEVGADYVFAVRANNFVLYDGMIEMERAGLIELVLRDEVQNYALYRLPPR